VSAVSRFHKEHDPYEPLLRDDRAMDSSLADVLTAVQNAADLPERRRQEIASALRTVARALGRPPERIPTDPHRLSARLKEVAPLAIGVSRGRWNNIRALVRTGLALVLPMAPGRHLNKLSSRGSRSGTNCLHAG
jgi:hypothetical protein